MARTFNIPLENRTIVIRTKGGEVKGELKWNPTYNPSNRFEVAQTYVDTEVIRLSDPMVPFRQGALRSSGMRASSIGDGWVRYSTPYARYQYYGKVMIGHAPKTVTNIPLTYSGAPRRGAKWFERMKAQNLSHIMRGAGRIIGSGK